MQGLVQLIWVFSRSFSMSCASFSMLWRSRWNWLRCSGSWLLRYQRCYCGCCVCLCQRVYGICNVFDRLICWLGIPNNYEPGHRSHSTGTVKHWKWFTWHRKASVKNSGKLNKFLHSEVNLSIQHIIVQDQDGQNNIILFHARLVVSFLNRKIHHGIFSRLLVA